MSKQLINRLLFWGVVYVLTMTLTPFFAYADTGTLFFDDGQSHLVRDNIVTNVDSGLKVFGENTIAVMNDLSITTSGGSYFRAAHALYKGNIVLNRICIKTLGSYGHGLGSYGGGNIVMNGGNIATWGAGGDGAHLEGSLSLITLNDVSIVINENNYFSNALSTGEGKLIMNRGNIISRGEASESIIAYYNGEIMLNDVTIQAEGVALRARSSGKINVNLSSQNIIGHKKLFRAYDFGFIDIVASNGSQLYGKTDLEDDSGTGNITLNSNATWTTPGDSNLTNLIFGSGHFRFTAPTGDTYRTLTVRNLFGNNGTFHLNSDLHAGTSDRVYIENSASGNHYVAVNNSEGNSGVVKVVDIGDSATNTATFDGGSDIGIYRFGVAQGSALSSTHSGLDERDYYLYNTYAPSTPVRGLMNESAAIHSLWYSEMNDIKKRMGELRMGSQNSGDIWARTYATKYSVSPSGGTDYDQKIHGIEVGKDRPRSYKNGKSFTGFVLGYAEADNSFTSGGSGDTESIYAGLYQSWLRDDGFYLDIIGKYNSFDHSFTTPVLGGSYDKGSFKNRGFGLSAEVGRHIDTRDGYFVEPQMEVSGFWAGSADYISENGLHVEADRSRSLQLRVGGVFGRQRACKSGGSQQLYGKVSWIQEFEGDSTVRVDGTGFETTLEGDQVVAGFGFVKDTPNYQIYLDAERSWGDTTSKDWGVSLGCRWRF
ncbi:autotransporter outer membrane beta-barrel domain-containing protein [Aminobacterium sp. MB27-C1]|uniref:autotransporter outer membrane beta-barrel domain-containing protein n=1 Tax=Aminobacterium sp. MB27-C1 TaxID=3070661 RepID=UPI0027DAEC14|nr:autotransporter outer membrane beta-barrel domain-containing protein [Aminobacterium sp. MB27-C1]WMI72304.1 autotransporter outer membrane beta-barrel domain-containing protein [Aminobacterium sp. MB27-C1]